MALRNIQLYGLLEEKFGSKHKVNADTIAHIMSGLQSQNKKLRKYLLKGQNWQILVNGKKITTAQLNDKLDDDQTQIDIVPAVGGAFDPISALYVIVAILVVAMAVMYSQMPDTDNAGNSASYMFNGAINTVEQGGPVPLVYGRTRVGSVVISAGVDSSYRSRYS